MRSLVLLKKALKREARGGVCLPEKDSIATKSHPEELNTGGSQGSNFGGRVILGSIQ